MKQIYTKTGDEGQTSLRGGMRVDKDDIRIETNGQIDHLNTAEKSIGFVLPCSMLHVARTQCRTVERRLWTLNRQFAVEPDVLRFFNRLSDYLFALAL